VADTRRRILDTARELFNRDGLHRVGVRDIARAVGISPGNLAYHFATKDDLVSALMAELHELNLRTAFNDLPSAISPAGLYEAAATAMRNMLGYRFVLLSYVDALASSPGLLRAAAGMRERRRRRHDALLDRLIAGGHLRRAAVMAQSEWLFEQSEMVSSGWLRSAAARGWRDDDATVRHFAKVGVALLAPYCTPRGARELRRVLAGEFDAPRARSSAAPRRARAARRK
jgi:AcrR family transcriptional regulator